LPYEFWLIFIRGCVVKNLVSAAVVAILILSSFSVAASAPETEALAVKITGVGGEQARIEEAAFGAVRIIDLGGTNILWVLGGGLVAVSLVARRVSS
jgi:hypothetical protein